MVSRAGVSCADKPPYVEGYRWLCMSRPDAVRFLLSITHEVLSSLEVDGVHLDYVRYPDVFLPKNLRERYGMPREGLVYNSSYDFCYCNLCTSEFMDEYGIDPKSVEFPSKEWRVWVRWRGSRISSFVDKFVKLVKSYDPTLNASAAVFPTPGIALNWVLQPWHMWSLDFYNPMVYHGYYTDSGDLEWIGDAVRECVATGRRIIAGLHLSFLSNREMLVRAVEEALSNGADGICFFCYPMPKPELADVVREAFRLV